MDFMLFDMAGVTSNNNHMQSVDKTLESKFESNTTKFINQKVILKSSRNTDEAVGKASSV